ncbi:MAG: hypothetical protein EZS28_025610 [Streblomastix strix]|uniref:Uncharacterized protein n=1 Tax=Streblomastix strix TaxID=222440 RepID=A0A5J4V8P0_9EUKA|nr:MAG: hypothetical protein EZS28_025610 [Streblomastix strix]
MQRSTEEKRRAEQITSAFTLVKYQQNSKDAELAFFEMVKASLVLELKMKDEIEHKCSNDLEQEVEVSKIDVEKQQKFIAATSTMVIGDYKSVTLWIFTAQHLARMIARDTQQQRENINLYGWCIKLDHIMITKLRASLDIQAVVKAFTLHATTSNDVDAYYYPSIERNLGAILLQQELTYELLQPWTIVAKERQYFFEIVVLCTYLGGM